MVDGPLEFSVSLAVPLGWYYAAVCGLNLAAAFRAWRARKAGRAAAWTALALGLAGLSAGAFAGCPLRMPEWLTAAVRAALGPVTLTLALLAALTALYRFRRFFSIPAVAWAALNASLLAMGLSLTNPNFAAVVTRPDNVPIVAMVYLLGFFLWLGAVQAVENDQRLRHGRGPVEKEYSGTVLVWPDLVYVELICMVLVSAALVVWAIVLRAPLEPPANPAITPNPSKAPWYFLGLQEMLVYFDASIAGVIVPCLIIFGLAAIPYLDFNPKGSGYYTLAERRFSCVTFLFGFLQLWILLILIGTFFRGPNWNFVSPYEPADPHQALPLSNVKLSEYFWVIGLGRELPQPRPESAGLARLGGLAWREIAGIAMVLVYFGLLPPLLGHTLLREFRRRMGLLRFAIMTLLLLMMFALPLKMVLRWTLNLSYLVSMPEYNLNF
jgi:hypothetical protein